MEKSLSCRRGLKLVDPSNEESAVRISKDQIPAKINVPGAIARVATDFGDATGFGKMGGEYFSLGAGTDPKTEEAIAAVVSGKYQCNRR
jgi:hypothetical protein